MKRYFVHMQGFLDGTAYIYFKGSEEFRRGIIVKKDGTEISSRIRLARMLTRKTPYREITEQQAKELISGGNK